MGRQAKRSRLSKNATVKKLLQHQSTLAAYDIKRDCAGMGPYREALWSEWEEERGGHLHKGTPKRGRGVKILTTFTGVYEGGQKQLRGAKAPFRKRKGGQ